MKDHETTQKRTKRNWYSSMVTPKRLARDFSVRIRTVYRWIKNGDIPAKKLGKQWRIEPADANAFRAGCVGVNADDLGE